MARSSSMSGPAVSDLYILNLLIDLMEFHTVGTDLRKVVTDGWDPKNAVATDIHPGATRNPMLPI